MKKSQRKIRDKKDYEKTFKVEYKSFVDGLEYWTLIHAVNEHRVIDIFNNELYTDKSIILNINEYLC